MSENYLVHHGILGMKWGIRRYQNEDGILTAAGRARMNNVSASKLKSSKDTSNARYVLKQRTKYHSAQSTAYSKKSVREEKKSNKFAKGTEDYNKHIQNSKDAIKESNMHLKLSNMAAQKLSDINEGKLKAGKDFIVQRDVNVHIFMLPAQMEMLKGMGSNDVNSWTTVNPWIGSNSYKIIDNKKK